MNCPQCHHTEIDTTGVCLVCGYKIGEKLDTAERTEESSAPSSELPPWRQELSERLQAIRQKKDSSEKTEPPQVLPPPAEEKPNSQPKLVPKPRQTAALPRTPVPQQKILTPVAKSDPQEVKKLIDKAISRPAAKNPAATPPATEPVHFFRHKPDFQEDKLILLSRTLTGLVDLMIVALCTGAIIIASDYFYGITSLDAISCVVYSAVFLLIYLFYSVFFLAASTQTIGMMITDLRVVGKDGKRPSIGQIFSRCFGFLLSIVTLGVGLAWSLFDSENRCFHDLLSGTRIVRI